MSDLKERVETLLASLGKTADEIADNLRHRRITGRTMDGFACPIANLLRAEVPEARTGAWDDDDGKWFVCGNYVRTPDGPISSRGSAVEDFVTTFDEGIEHGDGGYERPYRDLEDE